MNLFERYLTLWVALCIVVGIALGHDGGRQDHRGAEGDERGERCRTAEVVSHVEPHQSDAGS